MKVSLSKIADRIQTVFPEALIEHVTMFADSIDRYREGLPQMTKEKPLKAKDIIAILKKGK